MNAPVKSSARSGQSDSTDLDLQFRAAPDGRTYISGQFCRYPFHICRAQYVDPEPRGLATIYLQSSSGGIFANDRLSCEFHALPRSQSHITTQSSTIVHRMDQGDARHCVTIRADKNSFIEYLPDPMILFPRAKMYSGAVVRLHPSATVIMTDAFMHHVPATDDLAAAQREDFTEYHNETRVENLDGTLLCLDRYRVTGAQFSGGQSGIMGKNAIHGTFVLLNRSHDAAGLGASLRSSLESGFSGYAGLSSLPNGCGIWVRLIARDAFTLRLAIQQLWATTRQALLGEYPNRRKK